MLGALRNDEGVAFAQHDGRFAAIGIPHSNTAANNFTGTTPAADVGKPNNLGAAIGIPNP